MCAHTKILMFHLLTGNRVYSIYSLAESFSMGNIYVSSDLTQYYTVHFVNKWECTIPPPLTPAPHTHTHTHTHMRVHARAHISIL